MKEFVNRITLVDVLDLLKTIYVHKSELYYAGYTLYF